MPGDAADPVSSTLFVHYVLVVARQAGVTNLIRLLPLGASHYDVDVVYSDSSLHELVSYLSAPPLAESFSNTDLCDAVFDKFFVVSFHCLHTVIDCVFSHA